MTRFADPWLRWLLAAVALLGMTLACVAHGQGVALPVDAACLIQCSDGSAGTGVLVDVTDGLDGEPHGLIVTNHHVCRDAIAQGGTYAATFPGLRKHGARLIAYNAELDLAALEIANPPVSPAPWTDALDGDVFYTAGFAGQVDGLRVTCGHVVEENSSGPQISIVIDAGSRAGDSGGPVFDAQGRLCGIRWGTSGYRGATGGPDTYLVDPGQVAAFLREIGVEQPIPQQWPGTVCRPCQPCLPAGSCSPFGSFTQPAASSGNVCQQNPDGTWSCPGVVTRPAILPGTRIVSPRLPRAASPSTPSAPSAPSAPSPPASAAPASCNCAAQLAAIEKRLTDLEQRKPEPGPAGPTGPVGPAGPAGKDGSAASVDEEAIAQRVAAIVLAQQPSAKGVSHYVLVADDSASYWPRLAGEYRRAREAYSQIRLSGVPDVPVGQLPQLVAYQDGKPLGSFRGARDVSDALARIARNEPQKP